MEKDVFELVGEIQRGDDASFSLLCEKYKPLILSLVSSIFTDSPGLSSLDRDDLMQEANIALFKAASSFDTSRGGITFGLYAKICIRNRLVSIKRKAVSDQKKLKRHIAGTSAASKNIGRSHINDDRMIDAAAVSEFAENVLSPYEKRVFALYIEQLSYKEIAERLGKSEKSVDNAIYRIKKKLKNNV